MSARRLRLYDMCGYAGLGISTYNRGGNYYVVAAVSYRQALTLAYKGVWNTWGDGPGIVMACDERGRWRTEDQDHGFSQPAAHRHLGSAAALRKALQAHRAREVA